jgi:sugar lactone lactonase YvrE
MTLQKTAISLLAVGMSWALISSAALGQSTEITLGQGIFPESIASTPAGDLLVGSFTQGTVFRIAAGTTAAEPWITGIGPIITGVFAHGDTVYVCSNGEFGSNKAALKTFDLATAKETGSYDFPDGGFCSDIAVAPDGTVYVSHLNFVPDGAGRLLRLTDGKLEVVLADKAIAGIDGIAFLGDRLIANNLLTGELLSVDLAAATFKPLTLSAPMAGPDGMRTTEDGSALLVVEQYGNRLVSVTVDGDAATVTEVAAGLNGPAGVAQIGGTAYVVEANFAAMQAGTDPGVFAVKQIPLN